MTHDLSSLKAHRALSIAPELSLMPMENAAADGPWRVRNIVRVRTFDTRLS